MFKNLKTFDKTALIRSEVIREQLSNFESEVLRGISTLAILSIIHRHLKEGVYGYQLLKELNEETQHRIIIEEGTLYPILRKLEKDGILQSFKKEVGGRLRKYYIITDTGKILYDQMLGFFSKLIEALAPVFDLKVILPEESFVYCPNCFSKVPLDSEIKYCNICGLNIEKLINERLKKNE
ncbi:MAG: PadR family transcriptional regulator [Candidatus Heimdallarchaeaceae archaeon]